MRITVVGIALALLGSLARAAGIGTGFGENVWAVTSARQAGTGGVALEDPWREGTLLNAGAVVLQPGPRWTSFGAQGGLGSSVRLAFDGYHFQFDTPRTSEFADGSFAGTSGEASTREWGGRLMGQWRWLAGKGWRLAALARASGVMLSLPQSSVNGFGLEAGFQGQRYVTSEQAFTAWALAGPFGAGGERSFTSQGLAGASWLVKRARGFTGRPEGVGAGLEVQVLSEGLLHGGAGALYWIGEPRSAGTTLFLRAGVRRMSESAQAWQPRGGLGAAWRRQEGSWGVQFDYSIVPLGELGLFHYATLTFSLALAK